MAALCLCRAVRPSLDAMCLQSMALTEKRRSFRCLVEDNAAPNRFVQRRPSRIRNVVTPLQAAPSSLALARAPTSRDRCLQHPAMLHTQHPVKIFRQNRPHHPIQREEEEAEESPLCSPRPLPTCPSWA